MLIPHADFKLFLSKVFWGILQILTYVYSEIQAS